MVMSDKEKLAEVSRRLYVKREQEAEAIAERVKERSAIGLVRDLIFQCRHYSGQHVHSLPQQRHLFEETLRELEAMGDLTMTVEQLRWRNLSAFHKLVGHDLYCVLYSPDSEQYKFLKF